ncbi:MAG TPA: carbonate dehydratase [Gemmatimonadaceae bacterium]
MRALQHLFENNRRWAAAVEAERPGIFATLARQQAPRYLWIGCADSRVPANEIVGLLPGELFVHRNVANLVVPTDFNCLSVMQYAIDVLRVEHVIVCGHYGCGGVEAAMADASLGLIDNWLRHIRHVASRHEERLECIGRQDVRADRLCELNVLEQVVHVCESTVVTAAWQRGQPLAVHGWIYRLSDGLLRDLGLTVMSSAEVQTGYRSALEALWTSPQL